MRHWNRPEFEEGHWHRLTGTAFGREPATLTGGRSLEQKLLDGLNQTQSLTIIVLELLVIPVFRCAGIAIIGQRFSDLIETFP